MHQPHDCFFRQSMEELEIARDWLRANLPAELLAQMDLSTLTLANRDFALAGMRRLQNDCIYRCQINGSEGYIVTVVEHQSTADKWMAFRLLQYVVAIMDSYLKQGKLLPVVVTVVLYHGKTSPYPYSTEIWDCFENPALAKQWALKPFHLIDLTTMSDEEINRHGLATVMEMLLKHARDERILDCLKKMIADGLLAIIGLRIGKPTVMDVSNYVFNQFGNEKHPEELAETVELLANAMPEIRGDIMTFAQQLEQRGEQRGLQQGLQQGLEQGEQLGRQDERFAIAKKMLAVGVDLQTIKNCTGLPDQEISRLYTH